MKKFYIKQKVLSLSEKYTVKNEQGEDAYFVKGSFMHIPKSFSISNITSEEVGIVTKKIFTLLPKFFVKIKGQRQTLTIRKKFSFFKPKYTIDASDIEVKGNWWEMNFQLIKQGEVIGDVSKAWFTWGDSYKVQVLDEANETTILSIVIAIDYVKADQQ